MNRPGLLYTFLLLILAAMTQLQSCHDVSGAYSEHSEGAHDIEVAEGFTVEVVAGPDLVDYPMFATLDEQGRLFVFESVRFFEIPLEVERV